MGPVGIVCKKKLLFMKRILVLSTRVSVYESHTLPSGTHAQPGPGADTRLPALFGLPHSDGQRASRREACVGVLTCGHSEWDYICK